MRSTGFITLKRRVLILTLATAGALVIVGFSVYQRAGRMKPATTPAASILAAPRGAPIKAVVRVEETLGPEVFATEILESANGKDYHATRLRMRLTLGADTAVVMGNAGDVKPGAVVEVSGTTADGRTLHASQIVILNGYVRILPS